MKAFEIIKNDANLSQENHSLSNKSLMMNI